MRPDRCRRRCSSAERRMSWGHHVRVCFGPTMAIVVVSTLCTSNQLTSSNTTSASDIRRNRTLRDPDSASSQRQRVSRLNASQINGRPLSFRRLASPKEMPLDVGRSVGRSVCPPRWIPLAADCQIAGLLDWRIGEARLLLESGRNSKSSPANPVQMSESKSISGKPKTTSSVDSG